jgi:uncharacterized membrane protein YagU involved in acid resistance
MERRIVAMGGVAGAIGALLMGMFAMVAAATYQDTGFFTPLYHIASPIIGTDTMMRSMATTYFSAGPALLGLVIHLSVGVVWGVIFALIASRIGLHGVAAIVGGAVYGLLVMLIMAYIGLPITAAVLRGGDIVSDMATMVGWGTFAAEHAIYGVVVGAIWAARGIVARRTPSPGRVGA